VINLIIIYFGDSENDNPGIQKSEYFNRY